MLSESCQQEMQRVAGGREMSQPIPQARWWESLTYLEQLQLTQAPPRVTGSWEPHVCYEAVHPGHFGLLEEVGVLLGGQAGRSGGDHQQEGCGREQRGREGRQWGDRGVRFRSKNKRKWGLSRTLWLICQESALWAAPLYIPPGSPGTTPPALQQADRERSCQCSLCGAAIMIPFVFRLMVAGLVISTESILPWASQWL